MKAQLLALGLGFICAVSNAENPSTMTTTTKSTAMTNQSQFLEDNQKQAGVVTLPSGLQYKVLTQGNGKKPGKNDSVTVNYEGTLTDGTVFDSSYKRGQPATFPVGAVIQGWVEALQLMPEGSTWMLYIPANLAYGERGAPPLIGPNETLIFKVNLISIQ